MKFLKEPLLHFLLLGALIFAVDRIVSDRDVNDPDEIIITQGKVQNLAAIFERTWQRPPTDKELEGLIKDYVREEVLYREALKLGVDQDDTIIRRRLRQKMEFLADDIAAQVEPTDAELQRYLEEHSDDFHIEPAFFFRHVYLNPDKHGSNLEAEVSRLLETLRKGDAQVDISVLGDRTLLDNHHGDVTPTDIARAFGRSFAEAFVQLPVGEWSGPVTSGYGVHLVLIEKSTPGREPKLEEVRQQVMREWAHARRIESRERFYEELIGRYEITIWEGEDS